MSMKVARWIITGISLFLVLDGMLAIILDERYMRWGLEYTPDLYRSMVEHLLEWPALPLLGLKLAEMVAGSGLFLLGRNLNND